MCFLVKPKLFKIAMSFCLSKISKDKVAKIQKPASNVKTDEVDRIIDIALTNLHEYFHQIGASAGAGDRDHVVAAQNFYCYNQQQNPHTPNVMKSLGLNEAVVEKFCTDMLFPKLT